MSDNQWIVRDEVVAVLRSHPHTFVYVCEPLTVEHAGGRVRDNAVGVWNYFLDVYVFILNRDPLSRIYATYGSPKRAKWHAFDVEANNDIDLGRSFTEVFKFVRCSFAEIMHADSSDASNH